MAVFFVPLLFLSFIDRPNAFLGSFSTRCHALNVALADTYLTHFEARIKGRPRASKLYYVSSVNFLVLSKLIN